MKRDPTPQEIADFDAIVEMILADRPNAPERPNQPVLTYEMDDDPWGGLDDVEN